MSKSEAAICARFRDIRESKKWKRKDFAAELGITHAKLTSIEYAHTPLKLQLALEACRAFDINARWLATGKGEMFGYVPVFMPVIPDLWDQLQNGLLSTAYHDYAHMFGAAEWQRSGWKPVKDKDFEPVQFLVEHIADLFLYTKFKDSRTAQEFAFAVYDAARVKLADLLRRGRATRRKMDKWEELERSVKETQWQKKSGSPE